MKCVRFLKANFCKTRPRLPSENEQKTPILAIFCIISPKQTRWPHDIFLLIWVLTIQLHVHIKSRKFWVLKNTIKLKSIWRELIVSLDLVTIAAIFIWKISDFSINTPSKCSQYPGMFVTSPFCMFPDFWTFDLVFRRMVVQLRRTAFINKNIAPEGWTFTPLISISSVGTPLIISFLGFKYIELQINKLLPKSECRFYLDGMTLIMHQNHVC